MVVPRVFIAGVGNSELVSAKSLGSEQTRNEYAVAAGVKAMQDAGIHYGEVDQSIACYVDDGFAVSKAAFDSFGMTGASIGGVEGYSALFNAAQCLRSGEVKCTLLIGFDQEPSWLKKSEDSKVVAVAIVLVSEAFWQTHSFLKDCAVEIRAASIANPIYSREKNEYDEERTTKTVLNLALQQAQIKATQIQILEMRPKLNLNLRRAFGDFRQTDTKVSSKSLGAFSGSIGLAGLCELVWQLRGWAGSRSVSQAKNCLQYTAGPDRTASAVILSRSDGKAAPAWKTIEHLRDGRERLGYNPAHEIRKINIEDWEATKAPDAFFPKDFAGKLQLPKKGGDRAALARL